MHNKSYKAVLAHFDFQVFAGKLVYQPGRQSAFQTAPLCSLTVSCNGKNNKMTSGHTIETDLLFNSAAYDPGADSWTFKFGHEYFNIYGLWRLLEDKRIILVSTDNGEQFGLGKPLDLASEMNNRLEKVKLRTISIKPDTGDLNLILDDNLEIEIFISSAGYEAYTFSLGSTTYVGQGAGQIAIFR